MTRRSKSGPGRGVWALAALVLLLLPWSAAQGETRGYDPEEKKKLEEAGKYAAGAAAAINPALSKARILPK